MASYVKPLVDCPPGKDLATKVAHALLGWLNMYQNGNLHGDINISSVLALEHGEKGEPFQLITTFKGSLEVVTMLTLNDKMAHLGLKEIKKTLIPDASSWATKLEQLLETHNIRTICESSIIDGDMSKNWKTLFSRWGKEKEALRRERSGTELFMSDNLLVYKRKDYIQSPVDDIESFLWVTLYAILKNNAVTPSAEEQSWAEEFEFGSRGNALHRYSFASGFNNVMNNILEKWSLVVSKLGQAYRTLVQLFSKISEKNGWQDEKEEARYWEVAWHGYALQGVYESLDVIFEHITKI